MAHQPPPTITFFEHNGCSFKLVSNADHTVSQVYYCETKQAPQWIPLNSSLSPPPPHHTTTIVLSSPSGDGSQESVPTAAPFSPLTSLTSSVSSNNNNKKRKYSCNVIGESKDSEEDVASLIQIDNTTSSTTTTTAHHHHHREEKRTKFNHQYHQLKQMKNIMMMNGMNHHHTSNNNHHHHHHYYPSWITLPAHVKCYILSFVPSHIILKTKQIEFNINGHEFIKTIYLNERVIHQLETDIFKNMYGRIQNNDHNNNNHSNNSSSQRVHTLFYPKISIDEFYEYTCPTTTTTTSTTTTSTTTTSTTTTMAMMMMMNNHNNESTHETTTKRIMLPVHKQIATVIPWYHCCTLKIPLNDFIQMPIEKFQYTLQKIKFMCSFEHVMDGMLAYTMNSLFHSHPRHHDYITCNDTTTSTIATGTTTTGTTVTTTTTSTTTTGTTTDNNNMNHTNHNNHHNKRRVDISVSAGYITNDQFESCVHILSQLPHWFNKCEMRTGFGSVYTIDGMLNSDASSINFQSLALITNCKTLKLHYSEFEPLLTLNNIDQILSVNHMTHLTIKMMHDFNDELERFQLPFLTSSSSSTGTNGQPQEQKEDKSAAAMDHAQVSPQDKHLRTHPSLRKLNLQCGEILGSQFLNAIYQNRKLTSLKLRFPMMMDDVVRILNVENSKIKRLKVGSTCGVYLGNELIDSIVQSNNKTLKSLYVRGSNEGTHCCADSILKFIKHCTSCSRLIYFEKVNNELLKRTFERDGGKSAGLLNGKHYIFVD